MAGGDARAGPEAFMRVIQKGDINTILAAAGYNFSLLLRWFRSLLRTLLLILARAVLAPRSA